MLAIFSGKGPKGFSSASTAEDVTAGLSLAGRTILITGCNPDKCHEDVDDPALARKLWEV